MKDSCKHILLRKKKDLIPDDDNGNDNDNDKDDNGCNDGNDMMVMMMLNDKKYLITLNPKFIPNNI